jgi:hypothetical protein
MTTQQECRALDLATDWEKVGVLEIGEPDQFGDRDVLLSCFDEDDNKRRVELVAPTGFVQRVDEIPLPGTSTR